MSKWFRNLKGNCSFIVRRGWTLALGYIYLAQYRDVLSVLCDTVEKETDIEAKRNAVKSLGMILSRAENVDGTISAKQSNEAALSSKVWTMLTECLDDYTVDSRGDVGSWVRIAACESIPATFKHVSQGNVRPAVGKLLRLSVEKMDRVRKGAGQTLCILIPLWKDAEEQLVEFVKSCFLVGLG